MDLSDNRYDRPNQKIQYRNHSPTLGAVYHLTRNVIHHQLRHVSNCRSRQHYLQDAICGTWFRNDMLHALRMPISSQTEVHITSEQLIIQHGVLNRTSDYIELYRVVDFCENRSIMEQLFGLKTVGVFSGDRTNPQLDIYGVKEKLDVVKIIRERVEYNKRRKGIYEITNR